MMYNIFKILIQKMFINIILLINLMDLKCYILKNITRQFNLEL
jgi:hypothetical protein